MFMFKNRCAFVIGVLSVTLLVLSAAPAEAQRSFEPLFDKFNFKLAGSWVKVKTEIRLDSDLTEGTGTTLSFEDDLGLGSDEIIPTLAFEWQIARKHKLGVRWQDISRDSNTQALTEIQWGDEIIPFDADITLAFDLTQAFIDYTYYPWVKDRWAFGFGLGLRSSRRPWPIATPQTTSKVNPTSRAPLPCRISTSSTVGSSPATGGSSRVSGGSTSRSMTSRAASGSDVSASSTWLASGGPSVPPSICPPSTSIGTPFRPRRRLSSTSCSIWALTT